MKTKAITTIMTILFLLTVLTSSIATVKAEEYNRMNFQFFAKGSGRICFYSASTGRYVKSFDESMLAIAGTSEIEDMGSWYRLKEGTVKIGGTIWVEWTYNNKKHELHLIPKVGKRTSGYISWAFRIHLMKCKCILMINDKPQGVSEGYMFITLLPNQISIGFGVTVEGEPAAITLDWFNDSADVFRINTKLI